MAVLRRTTISKDCCGESPLVIDQEKKLALHKGNKIRLTSTEFRLLSFLVSRDGRVYSRGELITKVWQDNEEVDERTVDVHIRRLRKALEPFDVMPISRRLEVSVTVSRQISHDLLNLGGLLQI